MKIRTGFVSNSSSSSYILGIAKCIDYAAMLRYLTEYNLFRYVSIFEKSDISHFCKFDDGVIEYFDGTVSINVDQLSSKDKIILVQYSNSDVDEYSFTFSDFDENIKKLYTLFSNPELVDITTAESTYGAGFYG